MKVRRRIFLSGPDARGRLLAAAGGLEVRSHTPLTDMVAKLLSEGVSPSTVFEVEVAGGRRLNNSLRILEKIAATFEGRRP